MDEQEQYERLRQRRDQMAAAAARAAHRPVRLAVSDDFSGRMSAAVAASREFGRRLALRSATWEPHDWSDFA